VSEGWRFSDKAPMFIPRDEMRAARSRFEQELTAAQEKGEHYFLAIVGFVVDPAQTGGLLSLGQESLRVPPSIGCYRCELLLTRDLDPHCPGEPVE
jgi:hypothetical protein